MTRVLAGVILVLLSALAAGAEAQDASPPTIEHAVELYHDAVAAAADDPDLARARFAEAAAAFDAVGQTGPFNGEFYRAQGNAHFFAGDIGRAVLAYRRGLEREPGDDRLAQSLRVARGGVRTAAAPDLAASLPESLAQWRRFVPPPLIATVLAISWTALWGMLIAQRTRGRRPRPIVAAALAALSIVTAGALAADHWRRADNAHAVIIAEAEAFHGPSRAIYEPSFDTPLAPGVEATILGSRLGWVRLRLRSGAETWVPEGVVERVSESHESGPPARAPSRLPPP